MNKEKYSRLFIVFIVFSMLLSACNAIKYAHRDPFYNNGSELDHFRFPLIKPYYAIWVTEELGWSIPLEVSPSEKDIYYYITLNDVQKIAVENNVIMVYTQYEEDVHKEVGQKVLYWFAMVPNENIEVGFETETELIDYVQQYGIEEPAWREPDDILHEYELTWCLDWIPDCK